MQFQTKIGQSIMRIVYGSIALLFTLLSTNCSNKINKKISNQHLHQYKITTNKDTLELGQTFLATIEIDTTFDKDLDNVKVLVEGLTLPRVLNKYMLKIIAFRIGKSTFNINIIYPPYDTVKSTCSYFGVIPKISAPSDYHITAEEMPEFSHNGYRRFEDYIGSILMKQNIKLKGKLIVSLVVKKDASIEIKDLVAKELSTEELDIIKKEVLKCLCWKPGTIGAKPVNVIRTFVIKVM
jgi:hypothetical protein